MDNNLFIGKDKFPDYNAAALYFMKQPNNSPKKEKIVNLMKQITVSDDGTHFLYKSYYGEDLNMNTNILFDKTFKEVLKFHEPGLATVCDETGWYHINTKGEAIYKEKYKRVFGFYYNQATVWDFENNWFHINRLGQRIGYIDTKVQIDKQGNELYSQRYAMVEPFYNGFALVEDFSEKKLVISETGDVKLYL